MEPVCHIICNGRKLVAICDLRCTKVYKNFTVNVRILPDWSLQNLNVEIMNFEMKIEIL